MNNKVSSVAGDLLASNNEGLKVGVIQPGDSISKAGSTISKSVQKSNLEQLE